MPEHIIIALLKDGSGTASKALIFLRIDLLEFRRTLEKGIPRTGATMYGDVPLSKRTKTMLDLAVDEARSMGNMHIGTEHLLLAAMREQNSIIQVYLDERAVDPDMFRVVVQTTFNRASHAEAEAYEEAGGCGPRYPCSDEVRDGIPSIPISRIKPATYPSLTPILDSYSRDLTALARAGKLDPLVGRQKEIDRAIRILVRRTKNNPILLGEPGVGRPRLWKAWLSF